MRHIYHQWAFWLIFKICMTIKLHRLLLSCARQNQKKFKERQNQRTPPHPLKEILSMLMSYQSWRWRLKHNNQKRFSSVCYFIIIQVALHLLEKEKRVSIPMCLNSTANLLFLSKIITSWMCLKDLLEKDKIQRRC